MKRKKKKKKKKPARLKAQKGGLGKSQGQRKEAKEEEKKIGRSYQLGNLKMQLKKRIILQDESLEVWFKRNEHTNNC